MHAPRAQSPPRLPLPPLQHEHPAPSVRPGADAPGVYRHEVAPSGPIGFHRVPEQPGEAGSEQSDDQQDDAPDVSPPTTVSRSDKSYSLARLAKNSLSEGVASSVSPSAAKPEPPEQ